MATPYDLTTLAAFKSYAAITNTDDDAILSQLITNISRSVLSIVNRGTILPSPYVEIRDGWGERSIYLGNYPVYSINYLWINGLVVPQANLYNPTSSFNQYGYFLDLVDPTPPGQPQLLNLLNYRYSRGHQNIQISYTAGYQQLAETQVVPSSAPYVVTANQYYGMWGSDQGVTFNGTTLSVNTDYTVGSIVGGNPGVYTFFPIHAGQTVSLNYGYVPSELTQACMDWVQDRLAYQQHIGQSSKSLGGQETVSYLVKNVPEFVMQVIYPYRTVVPLQ